MDIIHTVLLYAHAQCGMRKWRDANGSMCAVWQNVKQHSTISIQPQTPILCCACIFNTQRVAILYLVEMVQILWLNTLINTNIRVSTCIQRLLLVSCKRVLAVEPRNLHSIRPPIEYPHRKHFTATERIQYTIYNIIYIPYLRVTVLLAT